MSYYRHRPAPFFLVASIILCLFLGFAIARTQEHQEPVGQNATLHIVRQGPQLSIRGNISSAAHEKILRQIATTLFVDDDHDFALRNDVTTPPGWGLLSELVLRAISETYSASALISARQIDIRGLTADLKRWQLAEMRIDDRLFPGMTLVTDMAEVQPAKSIQTQCTRLFHSIWRGQSIAFSHDSDLIRSSAFEILDELIQISADCPDANIAITGHTDNTGTPTGNRKLSHSRAKSVIAYMVARGIAANRLSSKGAGSAEPLLDEDSSRARKLNRRIEIEFDYPCIPETDQAIAVNQGVSDCS